LLKAFAVPFKGLKASDDVRHVNVVVVSCVDELSLLRGFLGCFFLAGLFSGLLLSCHIWFLSFSGFPSHDHKILC
jgi:hypothetical protein